MFSQDDKQLLEYNPSLLEDAELAFQNLSNQEVQLIKETEELFKQQVNFLLQIDRLRECVPNITTIKDNTLKLSSLVDSSLMLVEEVCKRFREIDLDKTRIEDSLSKISDILDLKTCQDGMKQAMQINNYEEAAIHIKRFLSINQSELQKTIAMLCDDPKFQKQKNTVESVNTFGSTSSHHKSDLLLERKNQTGIEIDPKLMNLALKELDEAKCHLFKLCQENMMRAIHDNNVKDIERFFKLFPMLNEHHAGLQIYSGYLKSRMIDTQLDSVLKSKELNQADKLAALFESVAKLIDSHQPMIETYYGPGNLIVVARVIQRECDKLSRKILEEFRNESNLQQVATIVRSSSHLPSIVQTPDQNPTNSQNLNNVSLNLNSKLDPRTVDKILNEISMIVSRSEVYLSFITTRIQGDIDSRTDDEAQKKHNRIELYDMIYLECELSHLIQEVGGIYVMLEQFYLNESAKKAIIMDQIEFDPSFGTCFISSLLDDIFFIIKKCTKRSVSTKSNEVFCAIINHCVALLESTFCQILEGKLKNQQYYTSFSTKNLDFSQAYNAIQSGRYLQSATDQKKSNGQYFSALNNLDKACEYIKTLRVMLNTDIRRLKPSNLVTQEKNDNQVEKSLTCLDELSRLVGKFGSIINSALYQLFNNSLRARIKSEFKSLIDEDPDLVKLVSVQNPNEITSLAKSLLQTVDSSLRDSLLPDNYARLESITIDFLTSTIKSV